jgi:hypothetical protein
MPPDGQRDFARFCQAGAGTAHPELFFAYRDVQRVAG